MVTRGTTKNGNPSQLKAVADYRLWKSRNMGHGSAIALMNVLGVKGSHGLLYRSERRGGAAHNIVGKLCSERFAAAIAHIGAATIKQWVVIVIRTDAFSSSQARSQAHKLQATMFCIGNSSSTINHLLCSFICDVTGFFLLRCTRSRPNIKQPGISNFAKVGTKCPDQTSSNPASAPSVPTNSWINMLPVFKCKIYGPCL